MNGEEREETAVFESGGKDTMKTVMRDKNAQLDFMYTVMTARSLIIQSVSQSVFNEQRPFRCKKKI